ncbi:MAG TPA: glycosyltransferase family 39 protein [Polyangiaceae bacterium]|jgi:hypothetical protein|nr:glycosyltransferase family 39 protein [Polyangiaceae bacterium]
MSQLTHPSPTSKLALRAGYFALALYVALTVLSYLGTPLGDFDEALQLVHGRAVLQGRVPHADFWSLYAPLNYYLNSWVFRLIGESVVNARLLSLTALALSLWFPLRWLQTSLRQQPGLRLALTAVCCFVLVHLLRIPQCNAAFLTWLVVWQHLQRVLSGKDPLGGYLVSGVACGLLSLIRINAGVYALGAFGLLLLFDALRTSTPDWRKLVERSAALIGPYGAVLAAYLFGLGVPARQILDQTLFVVSRICEAGLAIDLRHNFPMILTVLGVVALGLGCMALPNASSASASDAKSPPDQKRFNSVTASVLLVTALTLFAFNALPHAALAKMHALVPVALLGCVVVCQWRRDCFTRPSFLALTFLLASLQYYLIRSDQGHQLALGPGVLALLLTLDWPRLGRNRLTLIGVGAVCAFMPLPTNAENVRAWLLPINPKAALAAAHVLSAPRWRPCISDADWVAEGTLSPFARKLFPGDDELLAVRFINQVTRESEPIFLGMSSHVRTRENNARLAWLFERPLATRYLQMEPAVITTEPVQREIVNELERGIHWIVLADTLDTGDQNAWVPRSSLLDSYIASHYKETRTFGRIRVLERIAS